MHQPLPSHVASLQSHIASLQPHATALRQPSRRITLPPHHPPARSSLQATCCLPAVPLSLPPSSPVPRFSAPLHLAHVSLHSFQLQQLPLSNQCDLDCSSTHSCSSTVHKEWAPAVLADGESFVRVSHARVIRLLPGHSYLFRVERGTSASNGRWSEPSAAFTTSALQSPWPPPSPVLRANLRLLQGCKLASQFEGGAGCGYDGEALHALAQSPTEMRPSSQQQELILQPGEAAACPYLALAGPCASPPMEKEELPMHIGFELNVGDILEVCFPPRSHDVVPA